MNDAIAGPYSAFCHFLEHAQDHVASSLGNNAVVSEPISKVLVGARLCSSWTEAQARVRKCRTVPGFLGGDVIRRGRKIYAQAIYAAEPDDEVLEPLDLGWSRATVTKAWIEKRQVRPAKAAKGSE